MSIRASVARWNGTLPPVTRCWVAAGGRIEQVDGSPFSYGKPDFANPHFAAWGLGA